MKRGTTITKKTSNEGIYPVISGGQQPAYYIDQFNRDGETITVAGSGAYAGFVMYWNEPIFVGDAFSVKADEKQVLPRFIYHFLLSIQEKIHDLKSGGGVPHVYAKDVARFVIPLPPLSVQQEIVRILDKFTQLEAELEAELDCRKRQYEYYRNKLLSYERNEVEWKTLGEVLLSIKTGLNPRQFFTLNTSDANHYYITIRELKDGKIIPSDKTDKINDEALKLCQKRSNLEVGDILFSGTGTIGETAIIKEKPINWNIKEGVYSLKPNHSMITSGYVRHILSSQKIKDKIISKSAGGTVKSIPMKELQQVQIPLPPLEEQQRIASILDKFDTLVNSISEGLPKEIALRRKQYEYYREKLLSFPS
ncbi:restriction endonuclease subunit S [Capnocytophaga ochracea]|uniref:Restriction endonuclease subunit S n=1 Tax=Capnocytophaga ochracea TaxID=1018 RepID=A0AA46W5Q9_CAPOC|nr:restriction endonuclease subunit S [Capnocytophaga ochracea]UZD39787.1 restriction endonuclease subunit S [Capnocytophaga ochracea]